MNCSYSGCQNLAILECFCNNVSKYFCEQDLARHIMSDFNYTHKSKKLDLIDPQVRSKVIEKLENLNKTLLTSRQSLTKNFYQIISNLETQYKAAISKIDEISKKLYLSIIQIGTFSDFREETRLNQVLKSSLPEFEEKSKIWDELFKLDVNQVEITQSIEKSLMLFEDFDYIFTLKDRKTQPRCLEAPAQEIVFRNHIQGFCYNGHKLNWVQTIPEETFRVSLYIYMICNRCNLKYTISSWNCSVCNYNICENCGLEIGYGSVRPKCLLNHNLLWDAKKLNRRYTQILSRDFRCNLCCIGKNEIRLRCNICNYDSCQTCSISEFKIKPKDPKPICIKGHDMKIFLANTKAIQGKINSRKCVKCSSIISSTTVICLECNEFYCLECFDILNAPYAGHPILSCGNGHLMKWTLKHPFTCGLCLQYNLAENFGCEDCKQSICTECSIMMIEIVSKNQFKSHENQDHILEWKFNKQKSLCSFCGALLGIGSFGCLICNKLCCFLCYNNPNRSLHPGVHKSITRGSNNKFIVFE